MITRDNPVKIHACSYIKTTIANSLLLLFYLVIASDFVKVSKLEKLATAGRKRGVSGHNGDPIRASLEAKIRALLEAQLRPPFPLNTMVL